MVGSILSILENFRVIDSFDYYRDAWKNVEGMGELDAKHRYVGILLSVATEVPFFD